ncbi:hypothetical protein SAMN04488500_106123 [Sporomusa malonica]|uniref:Arc-like DNA binding domain-containing protein n=1 Tax=Sporomusa malonica TaxID=112901 RepID=A0A1W2AVK4_9FIRM|nr:hypothetical protein SAMN04488500_106123 [Sporomusa malonica]
MPSDLPRVPLRIDEDSKLKLEYIAFKNGRSLNRETKQLIMRYIDQFEKSHGKINLDAYCDYLQRRIVAENSNCFMRERCKCNDCRQRGGSHMYLRNR